jgi:trk system potassium uptake protein TrkH
MQNRPTQKPGDRTFRVPRVTSWHVPLSSVVPQPKTGGLSPKLTIYAFMSIIALGAILLMMPFCSQTGQFTSPIDAFFTSTSAVCVTGLTVVDTGSHFNIYGQAILLLLIQFGGFGFMTSATVFLMVLGRRIGLRERLLISESLGLERLGGLVKLVQRMAIFTLAVEGLGAAILYVRFSTEQPTGKAIWYSVFHSISAFNNCGMDILGNNFQSLVSYRDSILTVLTISFLIIVGGISFMVISDIGRAHRFGRLSVDSKIVLVTTGILLGMGTLMVFVTEFNNPATLGALPWGEKVLNAFFLSVASRTAGFSTFNIGAVASYGLAFVIFLMFIGGASGSTAGGIKVNTLGMLLSTVWSAIRGREYASAFGREFSLLAIYRALTVLIISVGFVAMMVLLLTITENKDFLKLLFEATSAFGTVGLSTGITPELSPAGRVIIMVTMFVGRIGPLALAISLAQRQRTSLFRYPQGTIRIG